MRTLLSDLEVMRAIQQFDLDALSRNPRIQKLMRSQKFKAIKSRISHWHERLDFAKGRSFHRQTSLLQKVLGSGHVEDGDHRLQPGLRL